MAYLMAIFEVPDDPKIADPMDVAERVVGDQRVEPRICDAMWDPVRQEKRDPRRKRWVTEFKEYFHEDDSGMSRRKGVSE